MSRPVIYDNAAVFINGALMVESTSVELQYQDSDASILLLGGGKANLFARSPGSRLMSITTEMAVPTEGTGAVRPGQLIERYLNSELMSFGVRLFGSGATLVSRGFLTAPSMTFAVGRSAAYKIGFIGTAAKFDA